MDIQDEFMCGVLVIDEQHKVLCNLIDRLSVNDLMSIEEYIAEIFHEIVDFTRYHFATEEAFWEESDTTGIDEHKKKHEEFLKIINESYQKGIHCEKELQKLVDFLMEWLEGHILLEDKKMLEHRRRL